MYSFKRLLPPIICWLSGTLLAFHPMIFSGLKRVQTDPGDPRLVNYFLEHGYRWLLRTPGHENLWSPAIFHPAGNTGAYTENLLGAAPFYWFWRAAGCLPDTSFQLWMITVASLNFLACYIWLRSGLRLSRWAGSFGALLFAYGNVRVAQLGHPQLLPHFYSVLAAYALSSLFQDLAGDGQGARVPPALWIGLFFFSVTAQIYAGLYLGWFLCFGLAVTALWAISLTEPRRRLLSLLRSHGLAVVSFALLSALALVPLFTPYWQAAEQVGGRSYHQVTYMLPTIPSWVYMGNGSWLYRWLDLLPPFRELPMPHEHALGIGPLTLTLVACGLLAARQHRPLVRLTCVSVVTIFLCITAFAPGSSLWQFLFPVLPGASAIRALSRIALLFLIPASLGLALFLHQRKSLWAVLLAGGICALEQGHTTSSYEKQEIRAEVRSVVERIDPLCRCFFFTPAIRETQAPGPSKYHLDAMWAQLESRTPTINGYSGSAPPGWDFRENRIQSERDLHRLREALTIWARGRDLADGEICWIR